MVAYFMYQCKKKTPCRLGQGVGYEDGMLLA